VGERFKRRPALKGAASHCEVPRVG
jgi:hypothetical protein